MALVRQVSTVRRFLGYVNNSRCGVHDLLHVRLLDKAATAARVPTIVTNLRRRAKKGVDDE